MFTKHQNTSGTAIDIEHAPTRLLVTVVARGTAHTEVLIAAVRELRRRADYTPKAWLVSRMNRIDAPPCACGRPGLYISGAVTYCRRCYPQAMRARTAVTAFRDAGSKVIGEEKRDRDARAVARLRAEQARFRRKR